MIAHVVDLELGDFVWTGGDVHIYQNHFDQIKKQLSREPRPLPKIKINKDTDDIFEIDFEDIELIGYDPHPTIKGKVSV
jgi:thymidylate synthase